MDVVIATKMLNHLAGLLRAALLHLYIVALAAFLGVVFGPWWSLIPLGLGFFSLLLGEGRAVRR